MQNIVVKLQTVSGLNKPRYLVSALFVSEEPPDLQDHEGEPAQLLLHPGQLPLLALLLHPLGRDNPRLWRGRLFNLSTCLPSVSQ